MTRIKLKESQLRKIIREELLETNQYSESLQLPLNYINGKCRISIINKLSGGISVKFFKCDHLHNLMNDLTEIGCDISYVRVTSKYPSQTYCSITDDMIQTVDQILKNHGFTLTTEQQQMKQTVNNTHYYPGADNPTGIYARADAAQRDVLRRYNR